MALPLNSSAALRGCYLSILPQGQSRVGADPHPPLIVLRERANGVGGQTVRHGKSCKVSRLPANQAFADAADPQRPVAVAKQGAYRPAGQSLRHAERHEPHAIKARHTVIRSHPQVTIAGLRQRPDAILRQTLLAPPGLEGKKRLSLPQPRILYCRFIAVHGRQIAKRGRDGHVTENPAVATAAVTQMNFVEGGVGLEAGNQIFRLRRFRRARSEIRIQPHGHEIIVTGHVLHLEDNGTFNPPMRILVNDRSSRRGRLRSGRM